MGIVLASDVGGAYDVPVASMLPVGMTGGSCPVGDGAGLRSGGMPAVLSSDGECIACVADGDTELSMDAEDLKALYETAEK